MFFEEQIIFKNTNINEVVLGMLNRINVSINEVEKFFPNLYLRCPEELFYFLKAKVKYRKDPPGKELIMKLSTFVKNNYEGDCDDFTVISISLLKYFGFSKIFVKLVGNKATSPSHVYCIVYDYCTNAFVPFDLTNERYGDERYYKYYQLIEV
ncbi:MAG: hypothetical protein RML94_09265 [Bacteroidia bacterium]|nr:hypothetical protein [Bacteroidia bacterium]